MPPKASSERAPAIPPVRPAQPTQRPASQNPHSEENIKKALNACSRANPARISIAEAARVYHIHPKTLGARARGRKLRDEAHAHQRLLTHLQEEMLVRWCQNMGWRGEPVGLMDLRAMVADIAKQPVGLSWVGRFIERNPELKTRWAKRGESKRASGLNRFNKQSFFEALAKAREGVDPDCIWNCDEKGIMENGGSFRRRVVVGSDQRDPKVTGDESRKMVTILECVSAVGASIPPLVIHEGAEKDGEWVRFNPCRAYLAASPNGWTDVDAAQEWLEIVFDPETGLIAEGRKRLLILDGHNSHCTLKFALYAESRNIVVLILPPHTTQRLQPLDVGVFNHLAYAWKKEVKMWDTTGGCIRKNNLITIYSKARDHALQPDFIRTAFRKCGIEPFDPSVITEEDMAPAEKTSALASLPIPPTIPSIVEILEIPEQDPPPPLNAPVDENTPLTPDLAPGGHPVGPRVIPLGDITNLPTNQHLHRLGMRQANLPPLPAKFASKAALLEHISMLAGRLDRSTEELAAAYAREVMANAENGRLRQRMHGTKSGRARTTHIKTGARILTEAESILKMAEADRKKVLNVVIKEMNPLVKHMAKISTALDKEAEAKLTQRELADIKAAGEPVKGLKKQKESIIKKLSTSEGRLTAAKHREADAKTAAAQRRASEACEKFENQIGEYREEIERLEGEKRTANEHYEAVYKQREDRLAAIEEAEDELEAAIDEEARLVQLAKEIKENEEAERVARRAKLPQRPKDAVPMWKDRLEDMERQRRVSPNIQGDCMLPPSAMRLAAGASMMLPTEHPATAHVFRQLVGEFGTNFIDGALMEESAAIIAHRYGSGEGQG